MTWSATARDRLRRVPRRYWIALAAYTALAAVFIHDWDGFVFERTVRDFWAGINPYSVAHDPPWYSLLGPDATAPQWYAYPPLPLLLMALSFAPAILFDLPEPVQRVLLKLPQILGTLLLARVAGAWSARIAPGRDRAGTERWFLYNPFLVLVGPIWGMTDTLLMAAFLLAVLRFEQGRPREAGLWFAASALVKVFPILLALPLLAWALARGRGGDAARMFATSSIAAALVTLPFLVLDASAFWQQAVAAHVGRDVQGLTLWGLPGLAQLPLSWVRVLSMAGMGASLVLLAVWAGRLRGVAAPLVLSFSAAVAVLLWNRVLNEQYLVMVIAPLLILASTGRMHHRWRQATQGAHGLYAAAIVLTGFHFLTFIPPDIALPLFGRPVDQVAFSVRSAAPWFWRSLTGMLQALVPLSLVVLAVLAVRLARPAPPVARDRAMARAAAPSILAVILVVAAGVLPAATTAEPAGPFEPAYDEPLVGAFYYLWWHNPAHDPEIRYGNWLPVSQDPTIGFYSFNRGIAQLHAQQMLAGGIDTAIVSYHRGELGLYKVFQEEAGAAGLHVSPLIELNQVYDRKDGDRMPHRPTAADGKPVPYAAYRMSEAAQDEIVAFVLDLRDEILDDANLRIDGRPVVYFYDAYVSGASFDGEDRDRLAQRVLDLHGAQTLQAVYDDPSIGDDYRDVLRYHPISLSHFYHDPGAAVWRAGHLWDHQVFWEEVRQRLESQLGPLYLISGDAYNDRAGFDAGISKSLVNLQVFDGSFIYSPSFTWGNNKDEPYETNLLRWEDRNRWMQAYSNSMDRLSVVGLAPAYDDTVNRPDIGFVIKAEHDGVSTYEASWQSVLHPAVDIVAISTWNEYFEGSSVEPSVEFGSEWLDATPRHRAALEQAQADQASSAGYAVLTHERQSRTHLAYSETDLPHHWGLDLVVAAARAWPGQVPYALDGLEPALPALPRPDWLLVEGGRGDYALSPAVAAQAASWMATVPTIIFGSDVQHDLGARVPTACRDAVEVPAAIPGDNTSANLTLLEGDRLVAADDGLWLTRAGATIRVGARCDDLLAYTTLKPIGAHPITDRDCLQVAATALLPELGLPARMACEVV